ncbi:beta-L-arabinofuranosidase domain-containing protein [Microbacterium sp.]|uniref:beta-L-arabinofuranosidase domain-containing protein n=1 Tax=Microbacterium sp. TaxID=51671 RepID=UPI003F70BE9A
MNPSAELSDTLPEARPAHFDRPDILPRGNVTLLPSRWKDQYDAARDYYVDVLQEDDILHGFRRAVGLPAPGAPLTGWCREDSRVVFGQWLSGLARFAGDGDARAAQKVKALVRGWAEVFEKDPVLLMQHYPFDKVVGGLVDVAAFVDDDLALPLLSRMVDIAESTLSRVNIPAAAWPPELADGDELEWYTLTENLMRAFELTGEERYRDFARVWEYSDFWNSFVPSADPDGLEGLHAYSHLNAVNGAAATYLMTGEERYLAIAVHAHDWFRSTQVYATGGFGPSERTMPSDGSLGRALEFRADDFESPCGSWAAFKLGRHLLRATGNARFSDWTERLVYNGVGAALGISEGGRHTYYADYRVGGGMKTPYHDTYACCSGSYSQAISDYTDLIFLRSGGTAYVNLYVPAEGSIDLEAGSLLVRQQTAYPADGRVVLTVRADAGDVNAAIALRRPEWAAHVAIRVDGQIVRADADDLGWIRITRQWGEEERRIEIDFDLEFRAEAVDTEHPERVAFLRGPAVYVVEASHHEPTPVLPRDLNGFVAPDAAELGVWRLPDVGDRAFRAKLKPFYAARAYEPYRLYVDLPELPQQLW